MSFMEEARKGCSVQEVLLDFMTVVAGVVQLLVSVATKSKQQQQINWKLTSMVHGVLFPSHSQ